MSPPTYLAGFATEDITPPLFSGERIRLGGYLRMYNYARKVLHALKARAICIRHPIDPKNSILFISCDLVGFQYTKAKIARKIISRQTGIPIANIIFHFTHSHTSPDMTGIFPNKVSQMVTTDIQYHVVKPMLKGMIRAGIKAFSNASREVEIGFGHTKIPDPPLAVQRRPPYELVKTPIRTIILKDMHSQQIVAVLVNYQGHPTQLPQSNSDISTEYPGLVAASLYKKVPGLEFAAYFNGSIGDVSMTGHKGYIHRKWELLVKTLNLPPDQKRPTKEQVKKILKRIDKRDEFHNEAMEYAVKNIEELGDIMAGYVVPILEKIDTKPLTEVKIYRKFLFPQVGRTKPLRPRLKYYTTLTAKLWMLWGEFKNKMRIAGLFYGYKLINRRDLPMLNVIKNGRKTLHQTELQMVQLNDITWVATPGEPFLVYQENFLNLLPERRGFFTNMLETCGYIFPWSFHVMGGYEETFSYDFLFGEYLDKSIQEGLKIIKKTRDSELN